MGDRFLDDANIKPRGNSRIQATLARAKQLKQQVTDHLKTLPEEEINRLINAGAETNQEIANNIAEQLNVPVPQKKPKRKVVRKEDNIQISHMSTLDNEVTPQDINFQNINQLITNSVREETKQIPEIKQQIKTPDQEVKEDIRYEAEIRRILQEHPEFTPQEKPALDINVNMTVAEKKPNYIVSKENGKVKVETQAFKEINSQRVGPMKLNREVLLEKQSETFKLIETAKIELEICLRMKTAVDKSLQSAYDAKIKDWQKRIKENELRLSTIDNLLNGR